MIQFDPYCYDSVTFYCFPQEQSVLGDFLAFFFLSLRSNYGRKLYFYFYSFLWSLVCYAFQSIAISLAYRLVFLPILLPCSSRFLFICILSCSLILCNFQAVDMESHNDDNDIDPSNDEELPPGSSTKEPKTSFTTGQVKELGEALKISQPHRSLENISTFLEEKFVEDSNDLVPIKKRLHTLSARPLTQLLSDHQSAESLSSVTQQLKRLNSVPQQRRRQSSVARMT